MASTGQFNARLDRSLKASGDEALSLIGYSPTQAVRALWEKAARRGKDLEEVAELLAPAKRQVPAGTAQDQVDDVVRQGWEFMEEAYASLGIGLSKTRDYPPDDQMLEAARYERLAERGLA